MVRVGRAESTDPLLGRPLSLHRTYGDGTFSLLYRVAGRGTRLLASRRVGDGIDILGPLGNGFPELPAGATGILVGGGIGIVPLVALAESLPARRIRVVIGARSGGALVCRGEFESLGVGLSVVTDDGSLGRAGNVVEALPAVVEEAGGGDRVFVFACGPAGMLRGLGDFLKTRGIRGVFSLEERMACGLGACLGCVAETRSGRRRVCLEGPVFPAEEIRWGMSEG